MARAVTRFEVLPPAAAPMSVDRGFDISPDGEQIVYVGGLLGAEHLFLRRLDQFDAALLPGTEGAFGPFFSPDGQWVDSLSAGGTLRKISTRSVAPPIALVDGITSLNAPRGRQTA